MSRCGCYGGGGKCEPCKIRQRANRARWKAEGRCANCGRQGLYKEYFTCERCYKAVAKCKGTEEVRIRDCDRCGRTIRQTGKGRTRRWCTRCAPAKATA